MAIRRWLFGVVAALTLAMPLSVAAQGELVVYCTVQEEWCRPMVAAFEKATGIKVLMTRKSSGEFYAQIKAEAANPRGDIWWGGTGDPHLQAARRPDRTVQVAAALRASGLGSATGRAVEVPDGRGLRRRARLQLQHRAGEEEGHTRAQVLVGSAQPPSSRTRSRWRTRILRERRTRCSPRWFS